MVETLRIVRIISVVLLLLGGTGVAWGSYEQAANPCEGGHLLAVEHIGADEPPDSTYERVSFHNLSAVEQRIFLEAVTGEHNMSRTYLDAEFGDVSHAVVAYQGGQYLTETVVDDCGVLESWYGRIGGLLLTLVGVSGLVIVTATRRFTSRE